MAAAIDLAAFFLAAGFALGMLCLGIGIESAGQKIADGLKNLHLGLLRK